MLLVGGLFLIGKATTEVHHKIEEADRGRKKIEAKFHDAHPDLWTPLYSMVTFSPEVPYSEALRVGDEQKRVMDKIMQLPGIENDWDKQHVMDQLHSLATETFGDGTTQSTGCEKRSS